MGADLDRVEAVSESILFEDVGAGGVAFFGPRVFKNLRPLRWRRFPGRRTLRCDNWRVRPSRGRVGGTRTSSCALKPGGGGGGLWQRGTRRIRGGRRGRAVSRS